MNKQEIEEKLEKLRKAKCSYPNCKKRQMMTVSLPIGKLTEGGKIVFPEEGKDSGLQIGVPLCDYHFLFAGKGLLTVVEQNKQMKLIAPTGMIEVAEVVFEAKEFEKGISKKIEEGKTKDGDL